MEKDIIKIFKCLSDKSRLQIIKSLEKEDMYVERLAKRLDLSPPTVSFHLKKLEEIGLVSSRKEQYYTIYTLNRNELSVNILELIIQFQTESIDDERDEEYKQKVILNFFEHGKLKTIPAQLKKKSIILSEIVKSFEQDKNYTEKEVNLIIANYHDDFATIRRYMIEFKLMQRENGIYKRI